LPVEAPEYAFVIKMKLTLSPSFVLLQGIKFTARKKMSNWIIIKEIRCESTNNLVKGLRVSGKICDKTAIMTEFQLAGRGQDKNIWHSNPGENLLVSLYIEEKIPAENYFLLTIITSLAIAEMLNEMGIDISIKWPNDIYFGKDKLVGILIENSMISGMIVNSILGIGINVNQTKFPEWLPNPTSMSLITGKKYRPEELLDLFLRKIDGLLESIKENESSSLVEKYINLLYRKGVWSDYIVDNELIRGKIHGVMSDGRLILEFESGEINYFLFGEIIYVH